MDADRPRPGTNVLVLAPLRSEAQRETCFDMLGGVPPEQLDVLRVTYSDSPAALVESWRDRYDMLPERMGIIAVGDQRDRYGDDLPELPDSVFVTTVTPNEISELGIRLDNYLNDRDDDRQLTVCFDSVTDLLQFADIQPAFKFLHMVVGQLREVDAVGHFHLDPSAHEQRDISRLKPLFDDAVDLTG